MSTQFSLLIQDHNTFGQMLQPFFIEEGGTEHCSIVDRLAKEKVEYYGDDLSKKQTEIIGIIDDYSEKSLAKRFSSKRLSARDFVHKVEPDYVQRFVRPFIEKKMARCIAIARDEKIPIYYRETKNVVYKSNFVKIEESAAEIVFNFHKLPDETRYFQTISHNGQIINLKDREGFILTNEPCWLMLDQHLYYFNQDVDGKKLRMFFKKDFILVPANTKKSTILHLLKDVSATSP